MDGTVAQTGGNSFTLTNVLATHTVQVTFTPLTFTITPSSDANGAISPSTVQTVNYGSSQTFTATPNAGYGVNTWSVDGNTAQTGGSSFTLTNITANHSVAADLYFSSSPSRPAPTPTADISPNTPQTVNSGSSLTFTAAPNTGYTVNSWLLDGTAGAGRWGNLHADRYHRQSHAYRSPPRCLPSPSPRPSGSNGAISPNTAQTVNYGSSLTFTATPSADYQVNSWSVDGTVQAERREHHFTRPISPPIIACR